MELLRKPKPILFNTEMVRAILDGRKTTTRRVVKFHDGSNNIPAAKSPYQFGDILYVRETWARNAYGGYFYRADGKFEVISWKPSIHMPREAARIFLRVTKAGVERLQDIDGYKILAEGIDNGQSNPTMGIRWENMQREAFSDMWDSTIKKQKLPDYGWNANPWVWVIEFERIR